MSNEGNNYVQCKSFVHTAEPINLPTLQDDGMHSSSGTALLETVCFCYVLAYPLVGVNTGQATSFTQQDMLYIVTTCNILVNWDNHQIPVELMRTPWCPWLTLLTNSRHRPRRERMQKQGCQAGIQVSPKKDPHNPHNPGSLWSTLDHSSTKWTSSSLISLHRGTSRTVVCWL